MADTGAPWNLPYPLPTDLVRDGADDIRDLAEAVADSFRIVDLKFAVKTDTQTISLAPGAFGAVTGLSITHSVADAGNNVLLFATINGKLSTSGDANRSGAGVFADGTIVHAPASPGSRLPVMSALGATAAGDMVSLNTAPILGRHTPGSTAAVVYDVRVANGAFSTVNFFVNRTSNDTDSNPHARTVSTLLLMEVTV